MVENAESSIARDTLNLAKLQEDLKRLNRRAHQTFNVIGIIIVVLSTVYVFGSFELSRSLTEGNPEKLREWPYSLFMFGAVFLLIFDLVLLVNSISMYTSWYFCKQFEDHFPNQPPLFWLCKLYNISPPVTRVLNVALVLLLLGILDHTFPILGRLFFWVVLIPTLIMGIISRPRFIRWAIDKPIAQNNPAVALQRAQWLRRITLNHPVFMYLEAFARLACNDFEGAGALLEKIIALRPIIRGVPFGTALQLLGWTYYAQERYQEALNTWQIGIACQPYELSNYSFLAMHYCDQQLTLERAMELWDFTQHSIPKELLPVKTPMVLIQEMRVHQARFYQQQGNTTDSLQIAKEVEGTLRIESVGFSAGEVYRQLGLLRMEQSRFAEAQAHFEQVILVCPNTVNAYLAKQALQKLALPTFNFG